MTTPVSEKSAEPKITGRKYTPCTYNCGQPIPCWGCDPADYKDAQRKEAKQ